MPLSVASLNPANFEAWATREKTKPVRREEKILRLGVRFRKNTDLLSGGKV
jgi:hypothetical protein